MPHIFAPLDLVPVKDKILVKTSYHIFPFVCRVPSVFLRNSDFSSISDIFPRAKKRTFIALRELKYEAKSA